MNILLASNNKGKLKELKNMLSTNFNILTMHDKGIYIDVVEDGDTFYANALKKAKEISLISGMATLADDSGLEVNALGGDPGVHSARYCGKHGDDDQNNQLLLHNLVGVTDRSANFTCCIVLYLPNGEHYSFEGKAHGHILDRCIGDGGFGYDALFYSDDLNKSFGQATDDEKNKVSHRAVALNKLISFISNNPELISKWK